MLRPATRRLLSRAKTGLTLPFLLLSLSACGTVQYQAVNTPVPIWYASRTEHPVFSGATNGDLLRFVSEYEAALNSCNDDKAAIKEWHDAARAE